jgi:murein DD-endopeptidase MepM/ murein hydrolase activator NlpD
MRRIKRILWGFTMIAITLGVIFVIGLWGGLWGIQSDNMRSLGQTTALPTNIPLGTPIARYAQIDPAFVERLAMPDSVYAQSVLRVDSPDIPAVGAYLPRSGDTNFEFVAPTPTATPLPFPTSPPLPLPAIAGEPFVTPAGDDAVARTLPYGGDACAPSGRPVEGVLTQRFHAYHGGVDWGVPIGTPVIATHSGIVTFAGWSEVGYGYLVIVQNGEFITYYAHNTSFNVVANQLIGKGSILAWSGSTGNSTGPHVHYETRINDVPVDPLTFEARGYPSC